MVHGHVGAAAPGLPTDRRYRGWIVTACPITLDARRRPTLPAELLAESDLDLRDGLVAYAERGRIVLTTRAGLLARAREVIAASPALRHPAGTERLAALRAEDAAVESARWTDLQTPGTRQPASER